MDASFRPGSGEHAERLRRLDLTIPWLVLSTKEPFFDLFDEQDRDVARNLLRKNGMAL